MTIILGGGIAGLSAAFYALKNPKLGTLTLLEASSRFGGWIRSNVSPNGIIFEKGPRSIRPNAEASENTLDLIDDLKLNDKIIPILSSQAAAKNRYIYVNNGPVLIPSSIKDFFKIIKPFQRPLITTLWTDYRAPKIIKEDESLYSFVERRLGKDVADYIISAIICGICAGDAKKISVKFLLKDFFDFEQKHGSIMKGAIMNLKTMQEKQLNRNRKLMMNDNNETILTSAVRSKYEKWNSWSLQNGLEALPKKLTEYLCENNVNMHLNERCTNITFEPNGVELEVNGKIKKCSRIISSLSAKDLSPLVQQQHPELARELDTIPTVSMAVVNCHFRGDILSTEAFGILIPPIEKLPILGVIFDSCMFPQSESTVLTVMMGGAWFEDYFGHNPTEEYLLSTALENLKRILNINDDPIEVDVSVLKNCIPQYIVGHYERIKRIRNYISSHDIPLTLCGSSYDGISINDVILSAKNSIDDITYFEEKNVRIQ